MVCSRCRIERVYRLRTHWLRNSTEPVHNFSRYDYDWICFGCGERGYEQGSFLRYDEKPDLYRKTLKAFHPHDEELK